MLRPRISTLVLLIIVTGISILLAIAVNRVNSQQQAIATIKEFGGSAYCRQLELNDSFAINLRHAVTEIEIPHIEMIEEIAASIQSMPSLEHITLTSDYQPEKLAKIRARFPHLKIAHVFDPLIDLIQ